MPLLLAACALMLPACSKWSSYTITKAQIREEHASYPGVIYVARGALGPYAKGPGLIGAFGDGLIFGSRDQQVQCPGIPGLRYEGYSYINSKGKAYIVVRKVPKKTTTAI